MPKKYITSIKIEGRIEMINTSLIHIEGQAF